MAKLHISELSDVRPDEMSGGELKRLSIARGLIMNPDVIVADEPTSELDDDNTADVFNILKEEADTGKTVIIVTHDASEIQFDTMHYRMDAGVLSELSG